MSQDIRVQGLSRRYGNETVVDMVDLDLPHGTTTALIGASGAGKSTLLRMIAGLETPDAGTVQLGPGLVSGDGIMVPPERRRIGLIFQDFALFPHLSAVENVRFGLSHLAKPEGQAIAADWLARVGLADRAYAFPHQLSGGEQQRVAIARALAPEPLAILMDEPFSGLDPMLRADVRDAAMTAIREVEIPALIVTHDSEEAMLIADRIAIMHAGKIIQIGTPEELYSAPASPRAASALGPVSSVKGRLNGRGMVETAFGAVNAPKDMDSNTFQVLIRPEAVDISDGNAARAVLISKRRLGYIFQIIVQIETESISVWSQKPVSAVVGETVSVRLDEAGCFVFPYE
ncbi:MAG: ABC transporter ATP-binding protein [Pseudomonadota bacterium]